MNVLILDYENKNYFQSIDDYKITFNEVFLVPNENSDYDSCLIEEADYLPLTDVLEHQFYWEDADRIKILHDDCIGYHEACIYEKEEYIPISYYKRGTYMEFDYTSEYSESVMLPISYYKGYEIYSVDNKDIKQTLPIYTTARYKQITFNTLEGTHKYICHYKGTLVQKISLIISIITFILFIIYLLKNIIIKVIH